MTRPVLDDEIVGVVKGNDVLGRSLEHLGMHPTVIDQLASLIAAGFRAKKTP